MCEVLLSLASTLIDLGVLANNAARALLLSSLVKSDNNMASAEDGITASAVLPVTDCQVGYIVIKGGIFFLWRVDFLKIGKRDFMLSCSRRWSSRITIWP